MGVYCIILISFTVYLEQILEPSNKQTSLLHEQVTDEKYIEPGDQSRSIIAPEHLESNFSPFELVSELQTVENGGGTDYFRAVLEVQNVNERRRKTHVHFWVRTFVDYILLLFFSLAHVPSLQFSTVNLNLLTHVANPQLSAVVPSSYSEFLLLALLPHSRGLAALVVPFFRWRGGLSSNHVLLRLFHRAERW
ncbi:Hypothetical_protein [Hexamita inflata]|uniref:Hypothetical_protein n=1 Tax=Hexamita inflata TaxID=28002 RepID=A0AA86QHE9_9EUKA|nr:Hypothetical protein HINF_LOCUS39325 [Hexamita inflata]